MLRKFDRDLGQMPSLSLQSLPEGVVALGQRAPCEIEMLSYKLYLYQIAPLAADIEIELRRIVVRTQMWTHNFLWERGQDYEIDVTCIEPEQKNKVIVRRAIDQAHALWEALVTIWSHIGVAQQPLTIESLKAIDASQHFGGTNG